MPLSCRCSVFHADACAALEPPQVSTIALTYAGQLVMSGLLMLEVKGWARMLGTRLAALVPALTGKPQNQRKELPTQRRRCCMPADATAATPARFL